MSDIQYVTEEKLAELNTELEDLKLTGIPRIAKRIDEAKQMGDLSENAEYHAAKEEMAWANSRVIELENIIENAQLIKKGSSESVTIGCTIDVESSMGKQTFTIVGQQEADPINGKISNESPIGSAFLGRAKGDQVSVTIPAGEQTYTILDIR